MSCHIRPTALALALPLASLVACGGGGAGSSTTAALGQATPGTDPSATEQSADVRSGPVGDELDGLTIRRIGLVRFDVAQAAADDFGYTDHTGESAAAPSGDHTTARAVFTTLDRPLDVSALTYVAGLPGAAAVDGCYVLEDGGAGPVDVLIDGATLSGGEVLTVSNPAGSWFELVRDDYDGVVSYDPAVDYGQDPFSPYTVPSFGQEGAIEGGTTVDVPGDAFPAFAAVDVPAMAGLTNVVLGDDGVTWTAGSDPSVPVVVDVRFDDYATLDVSGGSVDADGALTDSGSFGAIRVLVEAPADVRCITGDTGRFVYPEAVRATMAAFRAAGEAVAEQVLPGSDLDKRGEVSIDADGTLTDLIGGFDFGDADAVELPGGRSVGASRVATRHRVEGDALLIVQSTNGGSL